MIHRINNYYTATWSAPKHIKTLITTRIPPNSCSSVIPDSIRDPGFEIPAHQDTFGFNLATHVNDHLGNVIHNRKLLNASLPSHPHWLNQIHSNKVICLDNIMPKNFKEWIPDQVRDDDPQDNNVASEWHATDGDASITHIPNTVCVVMTADCLPILLTDVSGSFVASIHAGRAGLAHNIIANTINAAKVSPGTILAYIGPAICQEHYEVGEEIFAEFIAQNPKNKQFFRSNPQAAIQEDEIVIQDSIRDPASKLPSREHNLQKFSCDLVGIAILQLLELGLAEENIHLSRKCTYCHNDVFYSYRKEGIAGRFASLIWLATP